MVFLRRIDIAVLLIVGCCLALNGCQEKTEFRVSGKVTFQGQPVPVGEVQMMPDSTKGNKGPSIMAVIKDGEYETPSERGMRGGPYTLIITGYEQVSDTSDPTAADYGPPLFQRTVQHASFPKEDHVHDIVIE